MAFMHNDQREEFCKGFTAMMPLWLGIVPFAFAYSLLALTNGFTRLETMTMSLLVFAGSAQLTIVDMGSKHAGSLAILLAVLLLNIRHVLYAMTLDLTFAHPRTLPKPVVAAGMTDECMGITIAHGAKRPATDWFFLGTVVSLYLAFGITTFLGVLFGGQIPDPERLHLDVVFPLAFLALLFPLVRTRRALFIALFAAVLSASLRPVIGPNNAVLAAILGGAAMGLLLPSRAVDTALLPPEDVPS